MSTAAILGAGDLGGAVAHALVSRGRFRRVVLIDEARGVAAGKALDIRQACPIDRVDVDVSATDDLLAAAGADVAIVADEVGGVRDDARGHAALGRLARAGFGGPIVFAAPGHTTLMELVVREAALAPDRIVGTAASAVVGALRSLVGLEIGRAGTDVQVVVSGRPPRFVVAWSSARVGGALVSDRLPAHRLLALSGTLTKIWPPGARAIGSATAVVTEALVHGSRRSHQALTILDGEFGMRGAAVLLPLALGQGRVLAREVPSLAPVEAGQLRTMLEK